MAALKEKERRFLDENPFVGVVTTLRADGSPHSTVVWVDVEDGKVSFNTATRPGEAGASGTPTRVPPCWSSTRTIRTSGSPSAVRPR